MVTSTKVTWLQCIHHPAYWSCLHAISVTNAYACHSITKPRSDCIVLLCNFSNRQVARTFSWMMPYVSDSASSSPAIHHFDFKEHWYWSWGRLMMGGKWVGWVPSLSSLVPTYPINSEPGYVNVLFLVKHFGALPIRSSFDAILYNVLPPRDIKCSNVLLCVVFLSSSLGPTRNPFVAIIY